VIAVASLAGRFATVGLRSGKTRRRDDVDGVDALTSAHPLVVPLSALGGGVGVAPAVGAIAGVYPAARGARLPPTEALRAT
jgi:ABC-type lipoprotein release transport system permease subunit